MQLSVVIVNYNVRHFVEQCLHSVMEAGRDLQMEVFVVDNASQDDSVAYLRERFPSVHFIANTDNVGFSRANNQAIRQAQGRCVLLLNPDTLISTQTLQQCLQHMDTHPRCGAIGVAMHDVYGRFARESRRGFPDLWTSFCKMSGLTALFPQSRTFGHYYMQYLPLDTPSQIEALSGAFFMVRRQALQECGLLDEAFFMYGEDIDLSFRIAHAGWENWYVPAPIIHYKGESTQVESLRYVRIFHEAMVIFYNKHYRQHFFLLAWLVRTAVVLRAGIDVLRRMWWRIRLALRPSEADRDRVHCVGSPQAVGQMRQMLEARGALVTVQHATSKDASLDIPAGTEVVAFDTDVFPTDHIIRYITQSDHNVAFATYSAERGVLIMPRESIQQPQEGCQA